MIVFHLNDPNLFEEEQVEYTQVEKGKGKRKKIRRRANFYNTGFELNKLVKFFVHCERITFKVPETKRFKISFVCYGSDQIKSIPFQFYDEKKAAKFLDTFHMIKKAKQRQKKRY